MRRVSSRLPLLVTCLGIILAGCDNASPSKTPARGRLYEPDGGFSYDPPAIWKVTKLPGYQYHFSTGPATNGFAPNINVVDEQFDGSLDAYVDANRNSVRKAWPDAAIGEVSTFKTDSGLTGRKVTIRRQENSQSLCQTFYFFANGDRKYVVTCSCLADSAGRMKDVFDKSMKTFRLHSPGHQPTSRRATDHANSAGNS